MITSLLKMNKNLLQICLLTFMLIFIIISNLGLNLSMNMDKQGHVTHCPFMNDTATVCPMTFTEHLLRWEEMFTATMQSKAFQSYMFILLVAVLYLVEQRSNTKQSDSDITYKYYKDRHKDTKLFNYLILAFSDGIIHPKLYR